MKIFVICSKAFYDHIPKIKEELEQAGHSIFLPNCYDSPETESHFRGTSGHGKWKSEMYKHSEKVIAEVDAVLVLNYTKNGVENYIGGATFLEMYDAFRLGKTIYLMNDIPKGILNDEIIGFLPIAINGDLSKIENPIDQIYNKLVRDRIPEIIKSNGEIPTIRILDDLEFRTELEKKLLEEYYEVLKTNTSYDRLEELADMLEVINALGGLESATLEGIVALMNEKREKRGGFSKKIFLEKVRKP